MEADQTEDHADDDIGLDAITFIALSKGDKKKAVKGRKWPRSKLLSESGSESSREPLPKR